MKRELDDKDEEVGKYKEQYKKVHDEINSYNSFSNQSLFEKKKQI